MSILIRRVLTTPVALALAFAAFVAQPPEASADPLCVGISYTAFGTFSNSLGHCQPTPFGTFLTASDKEGDPALMYVELYVAVPAP